MPNFLSKLKHSNSKGFSLVELLIAMTIVMIMLAVLSTILSGINYQLRTQRPRMEAVSNAQMAVDTVVRLVRMAGSRPLNCPDTFQVQALAPSTNLGNQYFGKLRIQSDWNPADCSLGGVEEDVTFSVNNEILYLDANQQIPFVDRISALRFKFFDKNNAVIPNPQIQTAEITYIQVEIDTTATDGHSTTVTSGASIRK
ncbi:MAG TPA: type II secretion system protein [Pyrinomonadaceae bacterium]|nr:type II secretion system protein [Pyrinomonadaceae bacterium]